MKLLVLGLLALLPVQAEEVRRSLVWSLEIFAHYKSVAHISQIIWYISI